MNLGTSSTPRIDIVDFLHNQSRAAGANLVLTSADLSSLRPDVPTWVFGDRDLIDVAYSCAGISELHIFEFVRSDTGYWFTPATPQVCRCVTTAMPFSLISPRWR